MTPPRIARRLLSTLLPERDRVVLVGDLDEEFTRHVVPTRGRLRARAWYWRQVIRSMPAAVRLRRRPHTAGLVADIRFGIRLAIRRPALAIAVVTTLAIGVAVTTAVMSLTNAILLRPLPFADPGALVVIREVDTRRDSSSGNVSWPDFLDYRSRAGTLSTIAGFNGGTRALTGEGPADRVTVVEVTTNFLATLGVRPALGRDLVENDADDGAPGVVVLTDRTWRARFGAAPDVVGRVIDLGGAPTTVIGVLPPDFTFPLRGLAEMFVPAQPSAAQIARRNFHWLDAIGRLAPGATLAEAERDLARVAAGFAVIDPEYHPAASVAVLPVADAIVGDVRPMLLALAGAGVLLGLITAINIAGLLIARASTRDREVGVRAAIGATRSRIVRQLVVESLVLAAPATAIGLGAGVGIVRLFVGLLPEAQRAALPQLQDLGLGLDISLAGAVVAIVAALLCGLVPAWRLLGRTEVLPRAGVGGDRRHGRLSAGLVLAQVGIAVLLLTCAGLMGQSVRRLAAVSPGFDPDGLLTMRLSIPGTDYPGAENVLAFHRQLLETIETVPGVTGVATVNQLPLTGQGGTGSFRVDGAVADFGQSTRVRTVTANYFDVLGIPMREGRAFAGGDRPGAPAVVLVNESFARLVFDGRAVGRGISFAFVDGQPYWEIVGVVGDERYDDIESPSGPVVYFHYGQSPDRGMSLAIRTAGDPLAALPGVVAAVGRLDAGIPLFARRSMRDILDSSDAVFRRRVVLLLVGVFSMAALLLAAVGLYGVVSQYVAARTREIGVRLTLGASTGSVARTVLARGLWPAALGLLLGVGGSLVVTGTLSSLLFRTSTRDPATYLLVTLTLGLVALAACLIPTLRARRIDPVEALRRE